MASTTVVKLPNKSSTDVTFFGITYKTEKENELIKQPSNSNEMPVHFYKDLKVKIKTSGADEKTFKWIFYKLNVKGDKIIEYKFPTETGIPIDVSLEMVAFPKHDRLYHYKFSLFQQAAGSNEWVGCNCIYQFQPVTVGAVTETKEAKNIHFKYKKNIWKKRKQDSGSKNVNKKVKHDNNNNWNKLIEAVSEEEEVMKSKLRDMTIFDIRRSSKEFCDWLEAHRKRFIYQNHNAVMCSVVEVDGETFPATLQLELGDMKPICFPPPCSGSQLDCFINNQACWGALYDPSVWLLAQLLNGFVSTTIVEVRPGFYEMKMRNQSTDSIVLCAQKHMLHYATKLDNNAYIATTDKYGRNALHYAAASSDTNIVQLLLNKMELKDINHKGDYGHTPLDRCYSNSKGPIKQQLIKLIREKGGKRHSEL